MIDGQVACHFCLAALQKYSDKKRVLSKLFMCVVVVVRVVTGCFRSVSCAQDCDSVRRAMRIGSESL